MNKTFTEKKTIKDDINYNDINYSATYLGFKKKKKNSNVLFSGTNAKENNILVKFGNPGVPH